MKYKIKNVCRLSGVVVSALLMASSALAQNIYVASFNNGTIYDYTPGGMQNTFYSGIAFPEGIAFNSSGDLFVASSTGNVVDEITPGKTESTVASVPDPSGMAIDSAGDIFVTGHNDGDIWEIKAGATSATMFASGLLGPGGLAFDPSGDLFVQAGGTNGVIDEYKDTGGVLSTAPRNLPKIYMTLLI
jgi:DNA-binding beta-propeller fold protein YncE